jgi:ferredoxin
MIPHPIARGIMKFWWTRPAIDPEKCKRECKRCVESCPTEALTGGVYIPEFDYGDFINCLCCMEMCPQKAMYYDKSLLYRITRFSSLDLFLFILTESIELLNLE